MVIGGYYIYQHTNGMIDNYIVNGENSNNINITFFYRVFAFILVIVSNKFNIVFKLRNKPIRYSNLRAETDAYDKEIKLVGIFYGLGLAIAALGMFFSYLTRAGYYLLIFEPIFWGISIKESENKDLYRLLIVIYAIYIFMHELIGNGSGVFPYSMWIGG